MTLYSAATGRGQDRGDGEGEKIGMIKITVSVLYYNDLNLYSDNLLIILTNFQNQVRF